MMNYERMATTGVLCPELYQLLSQHFGTVIVANQGESMLCNPQRGGDNRINLNISHSGEYYRVNCPFCSDTRKRLWISHQYGNRMEDGRRLSFLANCYNDDACMTHYENRKRLEDLLLGFRNARDRNSRTPMAIAEGVQVEPSVAGPPPGRVIPIRELSKNHPAYRYIVSDRRYTLEMCDRYDVGYCIEADPQFRQAFDRIIFPIYQHGELHGWQARYIGDIDFHALRVAKYYGRPGMRRKQLLYNLDRAKGNSFVVVTEGVTDVHKHGDYLVATLGCDLSGPQRSLLETYWPGKPIVFVWDADAATKAEGLVYEMSATSPNPVINVVLPHGDPDNWESEPLWGHIYRTAYEQRGIRLW